MSHILTYSSIMPGTAARLICPVTTDPRCNRRAIASRNVAESIDRSGRSSIKSFYTTHPVTWLGRALIAGLRCCQRMAAATTMT
jgi:hypothetical protein